MNFISDGYAVLATIRDALAEVESQFIASELLAKHILLAANDL